VELGRTQWKWRLLETIGTPKKLSLITLLQNGRSIPVHAAIYAYKPSQLQDFTLSKIDLRPFAAS
jgi:hypothetical protein